MMRRLLLTSICMLVASSTWAALPKKMQITLDLRNQGVDIFAADVRDGYRGPSPADHTGLFYYENQYIPSQISEVHMLPYRVLDANYQQLATGLVPDTQVQFAHDFGAELFQFVIPGEQTPLPEPIHQIDWEIRFTPYDDYLLEIDFDPSHPATWLEVTRNGRLYFLNLNVGGMAGAMAGIYPTMIGSPQLMVNNGPSNQKIDLLIIGDGWDIGNIQRFRDLVAQFVPPFLAGEWVGHHPTVFNIWRIDVDGSFQTNPDDSCMWPGNMPDLRTIAGNVPYDQIMLIVKDSATPPNNGWPCANDSDFFTSRDGQNLAVMYTHARHELGHTLGQMVDEYGAFGAPYLVPFPAAPYRAAGNDVVWKNVSVWGNAGDYAPLANNRPFWGRLMGANTIMNRPMVQSELHHWFWDTSTWEGGAQFDLDIFRSTPMSGMCCYGAPYSSIDYNLFTKSTARFIPLDPPLSGSVPLISPVGGVSVSGIRMTFRWSAVPNARDYHLIVRRNLTGEHILVIPTNATQIEEYTAALTPGEIYSWTVIAANNNNETPQTSWATFRLAVNQPYVTNCGDLNNDGVLTQADVNILVDLAYNQGWIQEERCQLADVNSDALITHLMPGGFGDIEILNYWANCNPTQNPAGCGGNVPPLPSCTTPPGTLIAGCNSFKCGDYNGDNVVNVLDALGIARHAASAEAIGPTEFRKCAAADPSRDRDVSVLDALFVAQYAASTLPRLDCNHFVPNPGSPPTLPAWCN